MGLDNQDDNVVAGPWGSDPLKQLEQLVEENTRRQQELRVAFDPIEMLKIRINLVLQAMGPEAAFAVEAAFSQVIKDTLDEAEAAKRTQLIVPADSGLVVPDVAGRDVGRGDVGRGKPSINDTWGE